MSDKYNDNGETWDEFNLDFPDDFANEVDEDDFVQRLDNPFS